MMNRLKLSVLLFASVLLMTSCSSDDNGGDSGGNIETDFDFFISFKADGELVEMGFALDDFDPSFQHSISYTDFLSGTSCFRTCSPGIFSVNDNSIPQAGVSFYRFLDAFCTSADGAVFNTLFPVGNYSYSSTDAENGVGFEYSPDIPDSPFYLTTGGGSQSDSNSFTITSSEEDNTLFAGGTSYGQIVSGTFSCTVFNQLDDNDTLAITEGVFRLRVETSN
ncbi:hypothetical protein [Dokdonia sp.]|uniref:hypothetical protein n=1 Tax=Dokdonia sp. TaxID=2024995 RepID=UPI00326608E9